MNKLVWVATHLVAVGAGFAMAGPRTVSAPAVQVPEVSEEAPEPEIEVDEAPEAKAPPACADRSEVMGLRIALERARLDAYGAAAAWPAAAGRHGPDQVRATLEAVHKECGEGAQLLQVACEEPPCIGVFRLGEDDDSAPFRLQTCEPWVAAYDGLASLSVREADCGEDERIPMLLMGPPWPTEELTPDADPEAVFRRLTHRWDVLVELGCDY